MSLETWADEGRVRPHRTTRGTGHHATVMSALPVILGPDVGALADYLDVCRVKRNEAEYRRAGTISVADVEELAGAVHELRQRVEAHLLARGPWV